MEKYFQGCIVEQSLPVFDNQVPNLEENGRRALKNPT
jgi:hypothetical protein